MTALDAARARVDTLAARLRATSAGKLGRPVGSKNRPRRECQECWQRKPLNEFPDYEATVCKTCQRGLDTPAKPRTP